MDGSFLIPGLGSARPNEKLPDANFAPEVLAAAANVGEANATVDAAADAATDATTEATTDTVVETTTEAAVDVATQPSQQGPEQSMEESKNETETAINGSQAEDTTAGPRQDHEMDIDEERKPEHLEKEQASQPAAAEQVLDTKQTSPPASPPHLTDALEAALGGIMEVDGGEQARETAQEQEVPQHTDDQDGGEDGAQAEWEADSSPYESSSDSDSSDDSSDDDSGEILGVQETARLLLEAMNEDSDDEDGGGKNHKGFGGPVHLRSKNELPEAAPPKPDITIAPSDPIALLGEVLHIVDDSVVVRATPDGAGRVLDEGSVLCKEDRGIIGVVADVIGNVQSPMYVVRFPKQEDIAAEGLVAGTRIHYPPAHAKYVFTQALHGLKGSDASNLYDEEVGAEEMEFSDDEKEMAYKKELKAKRRGGRGQDRDGEGGRRPHPLRNESVAPEPSGGLNYDDDEDGPYRPLTRPATFGQGPVVSPPMPAGASGGSFRGRRGDSRGHRGHGGRGAHGGRGRGGYGGHGGSGGYGTHGSHGSHDSHGNRGGYSTGHSLPPQGRQDRPQQAGPGPSPVSPPAAPMQWPSYPAAAPFPPPPPATFGQQSPSAVPPFPFQFPSWPQQQNAPQTQPQHNGPNAAFQFQPPPPPSLANYAQAQPHMWPGRQAVPVPPPPPPAGTQFDPATIAAFLGALQNQARQQQQQPPPPPR